MEMNLRRMRERLGMSQGELAKALDVNLRTVKRWERGDIDTPKTTILSVQQLANERISLR